jgi:hypothetical protein
MIKKLILLFCFLAFISQAQHVDTPTFIPQPPIAGQPLKLLVRTSTPNQGKKLTRMLVVETNEFPNAGTSTITINICNYNGVATAVQHYMDTFDIDPLPPGPGTLNIYYTMSTDQTQCVPGTNTMSVFHYTVFSPAGEKELHSKISQFYPNPASGIIFLTGYSSLDSPILIFNANGQKVLETTPANFRDGLDIGHLEAGVYFVKYTENGVSVFKKLILEE